MKAVQKTQAGFTLIELVVVIVILGILAATALPKFMDLSNDARAGVMKGVEASMRGANTMLYAKAAAAGLANKPAVPVAPDVTPPTVTTNGAVVLLNYGYANDVDELAKVLTLSPSTDFTVATASITHAHATTAASCLIKYTKAAAAGGEPDYTTGTLLTGC